MNKFERKLYDYRNAFKNTLNDEELGEVDKFIQKLLTDTKNIQNILQLDTKTMGEIKKHMTKYVTDKKWQEKH